MSKAKPANKPKPVNALVPVKQEPENCGACHYWRGERCRRFPPEKKAGEHLAIHFAVTAATDWCGEFRRAG